MMVHINKVLQICDRFVSMRHFQFVTIVMFGAQDIEWNVKINRPRVVSWCDNWWTDTKLALLVPSLCT